MLKKTDIKHIARLARIKLTPDEEKEIEEKLSSVLDYIDKLKQVDVAGITPVSHPNNLTNVKREDKALPIGRELKEKLLDLAPARKQNFIKVKSVFNK